MTDKLQSELKNCQAENATFKIENLQLKSAVMQLEANQRNEPIFSWYPFEWIINLFWGVNVNTARIRIFIIHNFDDQDDVVCLPGKRLGNQ